MKFRELRADEIECRLGTVSQNGKGVSLLLYKDARVDANILDETVGPENWQCRFYEQKGTLFCSVGILVTRGVEGTPINGVRVVNGTTDWVWKDDAGAPSNMEAQKGEASDAFKRACFKWGIGRELYTAPFVWVSADKLARYHQGQNGKWVCNDRFKVTGIRYADGAISGLRIANVDTGATVWEWRG